MDLKPTLAICLSGSLRSIDSCYQSFIDYIFDCNKEHYNIKLFYFLPEDENSNKIYNINKIMDLKPEIKIEKDTQLLPLNCGFAGRQFKIDSVSNKGLIGWLYQIQGIEKAYEMVNEYERDNNITFDYILRARHDVLFRSDVHLYSFDSEKITIPDFHHWGGINDRFSFGKKELMKHYMKMFSNLYNDCSISNSIFMVRNAEWYCKYNLDTRKINYKTENIKFNRVRMDGKMSKDC